MWLCRPSAEESSIHEDNYKLQPSTFATSSPVNVKIDAKGKKFQTRYRLIKMGNLCRRARFQLIKRWHPLMIPTKKSNSTYIYGRGSHFKSFVVRFSRFEIASSDHRICKLGELLQYNLPQVHVMIFGVITLQKCILWEASQFNLRNFDLHVFWVPVSRDETLDILGEGS